MTPTLKYYNQKIFIDEIEFPNSIIEASKPELAIKDDVEEIHYQEYNDNNYVIFKDGTKESLTKDEDNLNKIIELRYNFDFEYKEDLFIQQEAVVSSTDPFINIKDLIETGLTEEEQARRIDMIKEAFPNFILTDEIVFDGINKIKKQLLKASDWSQLPDIQETLTDEQKKEWVDYRAALRVLDNVEKPLTVRIPASPKI